MLPLVGWMGGREGGGRKGEERKEGREEKFGSSDLQIHYLSEQTRTLSHLSEPQGEEASSVGFRGGSGSLLSINISQVESEFFLCLALVQSNLHSPYGHRATCKSGCDTRTPPARLVGEGFAGGPGGGGVRRAGAASKGRAVQHLSSFL